MGYDRTNRDSHAQPHQQVPGAVQDSSSALSQENTWKDAQSSTGSLMA